MTVVPAMAPGLGAQVDACDRCLALSHLTVVLCEVPRLRGTPEHDDRADAVGMGESGGGEGARERWAAPLVASCADLAPTPGELVRAAPGVSPERAARLRRELAHWSADAVRDRCHASGITATCSCSTDYPGSLGALADPPPVLYLAGDSRTLERCPDRAVGMVGTRRPTRVGREAARNIAMGITQSGGLVVSGMALGVDGASHDGALGAGGTTLAVLAGGVDRPTPPSHRRLYEQILDRGAAVAELPPGTEPFRWSFPARNRIIAALSSAVIVVEAPLRSGALITVDHAQDLGLDVFAVPGSLASSTCEGSNRLLCDGAGGVVDGVEFMALRGGGAVPTPVGPTDHGQALLHRVLQLGPHSRQELSRAVTSLAPSALEEALIDLELAGWLDRAPDGRYRLAAAWVPR